LVLFFRKNVLPSYPAAETINQVPWWAQDRGREPIHFCGAGLNGVNGFRKTLMARIGVQRQELKSFCFFFFRKRRFLFFSEEKKQKTIVFCHLVQRSGIWPDNGEL
jgi:hypothetical protein